LRDVIYGPLTTSLLPFTKECRFKMSGFFIDELFRLNVRIFTDGKMDGSEPVSDDSG